MKSAVFVSFFLFIWHYQSAQVLSQFNWNSGPVTTAQVGPNATSVSGSAVSSAGGVGGTNGLNAGLPTADINLTLPTGGGLFDVSGIEVSFDFQRDENVGNFFVRGSSLIIAGTTNLSVSYRVDNGAGGFNTVNSGNVYAIPSDNTFRNYRFFYLPTSGIGVLTVNGATVWTNDGPDNRSMYWTGAGNIIIGDQIDGAGANQTLFDNLIIGAVSSSPLPITLLDFVARLQNNSQVKLDWQTASEKNNDYFSIERSGEGSEWQELGRVPGAGNSQQRQDYSFIDEHPIKGSSYYRLKQTDFDGTKTYSPIRFVQADEKTPNTIRFYPNPASGQINLEGEKTSLENLEVFDGSGQDLTLLCKFYFENDERLLLDVSALKEGLYFLRSGNGLIKLLIK